MINPKVEIIILNWNGKSDTIECLESLKHITYPNYEILLVDNGSTDGSVECFREQYPWMEIIETGQNLGFAEGNNVGIMRAMEKGVDYVLLLNNDIVVDPEFLGELVKVAESDEKIGIVGPKVYYYDKPNLINTAGGEILWHLGLGKNIGIAEIDVGQFRTNKDMEWVMGVAMLIKKFVIRDVGVLDKDFFILLEDTEFCIRTRKVGYKVVFCPTSKIYHKEGISGKTNPISIFYSYRNRFLLLRKHYPYGKLNFYIVCIYISLRVIMGFCIYLIQGKFKLAKAVIKGYYQGILYK